MLPESLLI